MYFNSFLFVGFFVVVFSLTMLLRRRVTARNILLLIASYFFYACWDWRFLSLILISTCVDFVAGLLFNVDRVDPHRPPPATLRRRLVLLASLATNLGLLGFFKYWGFFIASAAAALEWIGVQPHVSTLSLILPVGISFYTFQTLSYTIDLYRGHITTERNVLNFALFVAFFPQLVAGPIERASRLLPQMRKPAAVTWWHLHSGFYLMCWGMFKKVVLADNAALVVDSVFAAENPPGVSALLGIYAFAIQIYCDFSGYSDIARGTARCLGFDLMLNFNLPYFATNPSDFWRRWHISLSSWLRDYLYISLGGNRKGPLRTYLNLMVTMLLGGLWHGAAWTFVLWGLYHALLLWGHRMAQPWLVKRLDFRTGPAGMLWRIVRIVAFFHLVCFGWLLFRAETVGTVFAVCHSMVANFTFDPVVLGENGLVILGGCAVVVLVVQTVQYVSRDLMVVFRLPLPVRSIVYALVMLFFVLFGEYGETPFIYFQF